MKLSIGKKIVRGETAYGAARVAVNLVFAVSLLSVPVFIIAALGAGNLALGFAWIAGGVVQLLIWFALCATANAVFDIADCALRKVKSDVSE